MAKRPDLADLNRAFLRLFERNGMATRQQRINQAAEDAASRVRADVGFDPVTIIAIITQVLPLIISCFKRNDNPEPVEIQAAVRKQCSSAAGKAAMRRRTMRRVKAESDTAMTRAQAFAIADGIIDEAMHADSDSVAALCSVIGNDEYGQEE